MKKFIVVKPADEAEEKKAKEAKRKRLFPLESAWDHYLTFGWFRLNKDVPVREDVIYGAPRRFDNEMKRLPLTKEEQTKIEYAERILFQFLRTVHKLGGKI